MLKKRTILAALILYCFPAALFAQDDARVSATWQVQKYDIAATLPQSETERSLAVKANLSLRNVSSRPASTVTLRISPDAEVAAATAGGAAVDFTKAEEKTAGGSLQRIVLRVPSVQAGGNLSISVDYKLTVKENSGLSSLSPSGAQFLPLSFWYPTPNSWFFARGADYAPYTLKVNSPGLTGISSGAEAAGVFENKLSGQPFFAAGNWDAVSTGSVTVHLKKGGAAEEQKRAAELAAIASEARTFAAGLLGAAPETPIRLVAVSRGGGFSSGGTIFVDDAVFRRAKVDSLTAANIAEAVAKLWLGGAATVNGDGGGAIREGLAKFISTQFIESKWGKEIGDVERLRQRVAYAAVSRRDSPLTVVSPGDDYYYAAVANKGAMVWRLVSRRVGPDQFWAAVRAGLQDGTVTLQELRATFSNEKEFLDYMFDQVTDVNLLVGLPQAGSGETKVALRNTGSVDATVNVTATLANGEKMTAPATVRQKSFGEVVFRTASKVEKVEIDSDKLYPQMDYSDDVAPRELTDSDLLLAVKRSFDKQDYAAAEKTARIVLREFPRYDDVRVLLARSLLAQNKTAEAEREFRAVIDERLPSARSLAWANVGLAEVALKNGQATQASKFAEEAIKADAEYGASLAARSLRSKAGSAAATDESLKAFFAAFDRAAAANRKSEMEALVSPGEITRFVSGISGQVVEWKTQVAQVDRLDNSTVLVEANLNIKLLNKDPESGTAVYRLVRNGSTWKLAGVEIFEVR